MKPLFLRCRRIVHSALLEITIDYQCCLCFFFRGRALRGAIGEELDSPAYMISSRKMDMYMQLSANSNKTRAIHEHAYDLGDTLPSTQYEIENSQTGTKSGTRKHREKTNT